MGPSFEIFVPGPVKEGIVKRSKRFVLSMSDENIAFLFQLSKTCKRKSKFLKVITVMCRYVIVKGQFGWVRGI